MDFNFDLESFFNATSPKTSKKEEKQKPEKKEVKKASGGKDIDVTLPVTVYGRNFKKDIGGEGTKPLSQIARDLLNEGFMEFMIPGIGLIFNEKNNAIYVTDNAVNPLSDKSQVFTKEDQVITVSDGEVRGEFSPSDFDKDFDEITAKEFAQKWAEINPTYEGCGIAVNKNAAFPTLSKVYNLKTGKEIEIIVNGEAVRLTPEKAVITEALKEYIPEGLAITLVGNNEKAFVSYVSLKKGDGFYPEQLPNSSAKVKTNEVEKKYPLPVTLRIVTWNTEYELTPEMFGGKEKVTESEITKFMAERERLFADKSRKVDMLYSKEHNLLSCMFLSGKKGAIAGTAYQNVWLDETDDEDDAVHRGIFKLIRSKTELEKCFNTTYYGNYCGNMAENDDRCMKLLSLPHGVFLGHYGKEYEGSTIKSLEFKRKLPLIPVNILDEVVEFFESELPNEACVTVIYNKKTEKFSVIKAKGRCGTCFIEYDYSNASELLCDPSIITVMMIHSHGSGNAFFSKLDDADEMYPGVFGVIGGLGKIDTPQMKFRARLDGVSCNLKVTDLFERSGNVYD
ncbi:MAG: Mov34/MPN/PAD-1 family protein [Lachnospiraceae bacterium]|nr:Mov34/MPN/PAD-1 family protein [Lachnospiraceae bacterium]